MLCCHAEATKAHSAWAAVRATFHLAGHALSALAKAYRASPAGATAAVATPHHPTLQASPTCEVLDHQNGSCTVALLLVSDCYLHHRSHSVLMASRATCAGDLLGHGQGSVKIIRPFVGVLSWINGQEWLNYIQTCIFPPGVLGSLQQKLGDDSAGSFQPFGGVLGLLKKHQPSAFSLPTPCPLRS